MSVETLITEFRQLSETEKATFYDTVSAEYVVDDLTPAQREDLLARIAEDEAHPARAIPLEEVLRKWGRS